MHRCYSMTVLFICLYFYLYQQVLYFHMFSCWYFASFHSNLKKWLKHFLLSRSSDELSSGCLGKLLSFIFEGQFCNVYILLLVESFCLSALWIYHPTGFWPAKCPLSYLLQFYGGSFHMTSPFSLFCFKILSMSFWLWQFDFNVVLVWISLSLCF